MSYLYKIFPAAAVVSTLIQHTKLEIQHKLNDVGCQWFQPCLHLKNKTKQNSFSLKYLFTTPCYRWCVIAVLSQRNSHLLVTHTGIHTPLPQRASETSSACPWLGKISTWYCRNTALHTEAEEAPATHFSSDWFPTQPWFYVHISKSLVTSCIGN